MRRIFLCGLTVFTFCALLSTAALASHNPADYPLRVNIFQHSSYSHYAGPSGIRSLNEVDGEGRANLFENGEPRGFDFRFQCGSRMMNSAGDETFRARWKKPGHGIGNAAAGGGRNLHSEGGDEGWHCLSQAQRWHADRSASRKVQRMDGQVPVRSRARKGSAGRTRSRTAGSWNERTQVNRAVIRRQAGRRPPPRLLFI
jgi:hypothetical protein